jgi:hypothetical protein
MLGMNRTIGLSIALLALPAGSQPLARAGVSLTGYSVIWPGASPAGTYAAGNASVATVDGNVATATLGPAMVRNSYRALDVNASATLGRFEAHDIDAEVDAACIRTHADVVVVRRAHCVMTGEPQLGRINMPFGLQVTSAKTVLVEDSRFDGFQWRAPDYRYWQGEGVSIERGVAGVQFRRVSANRNTDAGFDIKPYALMSDVSAEDNCRNFRFWSGADVGTLTTGDTVKRGGISSCSGIWLNGSDSGPRFTLHIKKLVVRMKRSGTIIEVENGPADVHIDACDIDAPAGTEMIRFDDGAGEVRLGVGCELPRSTA